VRYSIAGMLFREIYGVDVSTREILVISIGASKYVSSVERELWANVNGDWYLSFQVGWCVCGAYCCGWI
jgi:hypothetical protein